MPVIYKITSPSNKVYIGQSWSWIKRKSVYRRLACKSQTHLYNSLVKYGFENHSFEILEELPESILQEELDKLEIYYWQEYINNGYEMLNVREPGRGGKSSPESVEKCRQTRKERAALRGYWYSEESIKRRAASQTGAKRSKEFCERLSKLKKGRKPSQDTIEKMRKSLTGRKLPREVVEKMLKSRAGYTHSEETRIKIGNARRGKPGPKNTYNSKAVINIKTGDLFRTIKEAAVYFNICPVFLAAKLRGKFKNNTDFRYFYEYNLQRLHKTPSR